MTRPWNMANVVWLVWLMVLCASISGLLSQCPRLCECKWKSGKESVICINANLTSIPTHLDAGTQILDLRANHINTVRNDEFSRYGLLNLQKIYLIHCHLKNLERWAFRDVINLVELDLSFNLLTSVPSHTFEAIPELRELKLNGNPLQRLGSEAFVHISHLIRLELSDCRLHDIDSYAFQGLERRLEWLKLDRNRLAQVNADSFVHLRNLHGIELAGNPWNCSCVLRPLREWMVRQNVPFGVPPVCHAPERLQNKPWDKLDLDEFACSPEIVPFVELTRGVEGKNVTMTCKIAGVPEPSIRWMLKNKVIANLSHTNGGSGGGGGGGGGAGVSVGGRRVYMVHLQNSSSELTIYGAELQDAGVYVCAAENKAGRAEASVTLAVMRKPPDTSVNGRVIMTGIAAGLALLSGVCVAVVCLLVRRKPHDLSSECRIDENYEKIELNHHANRNGSGPLATATAEMAVVATRKNGEYRVVPVMDEATARKAAASAALPASSVLDVPNSGDGGGGGGGGAGNCVPKVGGGTPAQWNDKLDTRWNSPVQHLNKHGADLHIPRRILQDDRDDVLRGSATLMSGTSRYHHNEYPPWLTKYPDLIVENSSASASNINATDPQSAAMFCTLPRKRGTLQSHYHSTESQAPLLEEDHNQMDRLLEEYRCLQSQFATRSTPPLSPPPPQPSTESSTVSQSPVHCQIVATDADPSSVALHESVEFRNFQNELTRFLQSRNGLVSTNI